MDSLCNLRVRRGMSRIWHIESAECSAIALHCRCPVIAHPIGGSYRLSRISISRGVQKSLRFAGFREHQPADCRIFAKPIPSRSACVGAHVCGGNAPHKHIRVRVLASWAQGGGERLASARRDGTYGDELQRRTKTWAWKGSLARRGVPGRIRCGRGKSRGPVSQRHPHHHAAQKRRGQFSQDHGQKKLKTFGRWVGGREPQMSRTESVRRDFRNPRSRPLDLLS